MKINKEIISYLFFGVATTIVNILCFQLFGFIFGQEAYQLNNILSWIITIAFAFVTNKLWVFDSKSWIWSVVKSELIGFLSARIFSLILEEAGLFLMIDILRFKEFSFSVLSFAITGSLIAKFIMQVIVILSNYVFSKFLIFKKKQ